MPIRIGEKKNMSFVLCDLKDLLSIFVCLHFDAREKNQLATFELIDQIEKSLKSGFKRENSA